MTPNDELDDHINSLDGTEYDGLSLSWKLRCIEADQERKRSGNGNAAQLDPWADPDWSILDDRRGSLPEFPIGFLSGACREWVERTARRCWRNHCPCRRSAARNRVEFNRKLAQDNGVEVIHPARDLLDCGCRVFWLRQNAGH
jgi:hypothetical protein